MLFLTLFLVRSPLIEVRTARRVLRCADAVTMTRWGGKAAWPFGASCINSVRELNRIKLCRFVALSMVICSIAFHVIVFVNRRYVV